MKLTVQWVDHPRIDFYKLVVGVTPNGVVVFRSQSLKKTLTDSVQKISVGNVCVLNFSNG